jgi:hypothetical protein
MARTLSCLAISAAYTQNESGIILHWRTWRCEQHGFDEGTRCIKCNEVPPLAVTLLLIVKKYMRMRNRYKLAYGYHLEFIRLNLEDSNSTTIDPDQAMLVTGTRLRSVTAIRSIKKEAARITIIHAGTCELFSRPTLSLPRSLHFWQGP